MANEPSVFYLPLKLWRNGVEAQTVAPFVPALAVSNKVRSTTVVLTESEGTKEQGLYVWTGSEWRFALPLGEVSKAIIEGSVLQVYYAQTQDTPVPSGSTVFVNGGSTSKTVITTEPKLVWTVLSPAFTPEPWILTVNNIGPNENGNVEVDVEDIPGLKEDLESSVKTVNGLEPDEDGNVQLPSQGGVASVNGISPDADGNVELDIRPHNYQGTYNPVTDVPELPEAAADNEGMFWEIEEAGTVDGIQYEVGDYIVSRGDLYYKIDNQVKTWTVNGKSGHVVLTQDDILPAYSVGISKVGATSLDAGDPLVDPQFNIVYARPATTSRIVVGTDTYQLAGATSFTVPQTFNGQFNDSVRFTVFASETGSSPEKSAFVDVRWMLNTFWGVSDIPLGYDQAFVEALSNKALASSRGRTITVTAGAGQHIYYVLRTAYGTPTFTVGGFAGGFVLDDTINITNAYGTSTSYDIWRSENPDLGPTTVVIT